MPHDCRPRGSQALVLAVVVPAAAVADVADFGPQYQHQSDKKPGTQAAGVRVENNVLTISNPAGNHQAISIWIVRIKAGQVSVRRDGLLKKALIFNPVDSDLAFTVPQFDVFMRRVHPYDPNERPSRGRRPKPAV
jgi:hypothetical protein